MTKGIVNVEVVIAQVSAHRVIAGGDAPVLFVSARGALEKQVRLVARIIHLNRHVTEVRRDVLRVRGRKDIHGTLCIDIDNDGSGTVPGAFQRDQGETGFGVDDDLGDHAGIEIDRLRVECDVNRTVGILNELEIVD